MWRSDTLIVGAPISRATLERVGLIHRRVATARASCAGDGDDVWGRRSWRCGWSGQRRCWIGLAPRSIPKAEGYVTAALTVPVTLSPCHNLVSVVPSRR